MSALFVTVVVFIVYSLEHLFYTFIWHKPQQFQKMIDCKPDLDPCKGVHIGLIINKTLQLLTLCWVCYIYDADFMNPFQLGPWVQLSMLISVVFCALAQFLNFSVYNAIGFNGVYYGNKFGKRIPWCTSFPYNVNWLKHPQYLGAWFFYINFGFLLKNVVSAQYGFHELMTNMQIFITLSYIYMSIIESH